MKKNGREKKLIENIGGTLLRREGRREILDFLILPLISMQPTNTESTLN